jgi:hypothetical protein
MLDAENAAENELGNKPENFSAVADYPCRRMMNF